MSYILLRPLCVQLKNNDPDVSLQYAAACNVTDESGTVIKERKCLGECGTRGSDIIYEGRNLIAYFCCSPHHRGGHDSSEEEDGFDFRPFGDDSEEDSSEEWSSGDVDEDDFRPFGGQGGRPFGNDEDGDMEDEEFAGFPGGRPNFGGRPERPEFGGDQERPTSGGSQERPTSGARPQRPQTGGRRSHFGVRLQEPWAPLCQISIGFRRVMKYVPIQILSNLCQYWYRPTLGHIAVTAEVQAFKWVL